MVVEVVMEIGYDDCRGCFDVDDALPIVVVSLREWIEMGFGDHV